jgi:dTDP-4-dehydrorhamnose 3,5-epimerase
MVGEFYTPGMEGGLRHDDPELGLEWPLPVEVISAKDRGWNRLQEIEPDLRLRMTPFPPGFEGTAFEPAR